MSWSSSNAGKINRIGIKYQGYLPAEGGGIWLASAFFQIFLGPLAPFREKFLSTGYHIDSISFSKKVNWLHAIAITMNKIFIVPMPAVVYLNVILCSVYNFQAV